MGLWDRHRWGWKKTEWFSFVLILGLLLLHPVLNGYPFLFGDSWAYCCKCPDETRSPVLGCLLRPVVLAAGNWGYVVIQCAAAAFAFAFLSGIVLKRNHPYALVVSLLVSGAGIFAGWILADIWTLIGLICLFAISAGYAFPAIALLLSLSCSTHFGNFPTVSAAALMVLPLVREKAKFVARTSLCIIAAIVFVVASNSFGGVLKFSSGNGLIFLASRILHDMPELMEDMCQDDPEFGLCQRKEEVRQWSHADPGTFIWSVAENLSISLPQFNELSRKIIVYSISTFPGYYFKHLTAAVRNTFQLFSFYELSDGHVPYWQDSYVLDSMQECFPKDTNDYLKSWQGGGRLQGFLKRVDMPLTILFWLSTLICLASAMACWQARYEDTLIQLAMFALIAVVVNAFFMSNISGVFSRYHTRVGFLLIFPGVALSCRWIGLGIERFHLHRQA
jgi:hypothetical protein